MSLNIVEPPTCYEDNRTEESLTLFAISEDTAVDFKRNVDGLVGALKQMGQMMISMQQRLDELEEHRRQVTLNHDEVKGVMALIRIRAGEYCEKYSLSDEGSRKAVRAAMKRDILKRYGVKDLHDVPAIARQAVEAQLSHWANIRLVMDRREKLREGGA